MNQSGFLRVAAVSPSLKVANTLYNTEQIITCAQQAAEKGAAVILFPELSVTAYTCADLFYQENLSGESRRAAPHLEASRTVDAVIIAGFYLRFATVSTTVPLSFSTETSSASCRRCFFPTAANSTRDAGLPQGSASLPMSAPSVCSAPRFLSGICSSPMKRAASPSASKSARICGCRLHREHIWH